MSQQYERLIKSMDYCRSLIDFIPKVGVVLGSGLGDYAKDMEIVYEISYKDIPEFPVSTVEGHAGKLLFGYIEAVPVVLMQGRVHYYEGYSMQDVVLPIRLMMLLGAEYIILTNASGGVSEVFAPGDFMLIKDHIASFVPSPLIGENVSEMGERFPDMTHIYDKELMDIAYESARENKIDLQSGIYVQSSGPNYESASEVNMFKLLGADAVGMSTACEAIAAKHAGAKICAISFITNKATGTTDNILSHEEVQETANAKSEDFKKLITGIIKRIPNIEQ